MAVILDAWQLAKSWSVGRYIVMPDHLHLFCVPADVMGSLLEKYRIKKLAATTRTADLATGFLGHAIAAFRKL